MEWLLANPQIYSTFASLGTMEGENYIVSENCLIHLEEIHCKLATEDHTLRTFRRAIGFGNNIKNDLIPLLLHVKESHILDACIRLLVNLTVPIECLLPVDVMSKTEIGRHTIYELNKLLLSAKVAFVDSKSTKAVIDYMKYILEMESKLSLQQCDSVNNCLLLLRNILHIPDVSCHHTNSSSTHSPNSNTPGHENGCNNCNTSLQNQIIWHLFTQSIDKLLIHLMSCPQRAFWGVTIAQLIALIYKDQHVSTLSKLLNIWFETTQSESSEDNESNTSPPKSGDSSPTLTSEPTSDSSDGGGGTKGQNSTNKEDNEDTTQITRMGTEFPTQIIRSKPVKNHQNYQHTKHDNNKIQATSQNASDSKPKPLKEFVKPKQDQQHYSQPQEPHKQTPCLKKSDSIQSENSACSSKQGKQENLSENSDCGYGTQVEKESISTSSNEDEQQVKPIHQKPPPNQKQRFNAANKQRYPTSVQDKRELRRKKLVKRSKSNILNMKGLIHHIPTDDDISNILKEFTVDFLLKGYGHLVEELHAQLMIDFQIQIDTSHFFWLVTYFLKFATQLELDLEHINTVLSFDIISYLTYEGVTLCEQLELLNKQPGADLKPCLRRIHLVVTAIREFLQALESYKKSSHLTNEDKVHLRILQIHISVTDDLKHLFVLLLRCYSTHFQSKQYLQDLIVTNHILLLLLDGVKDIPGYKGNIQIEQHIKQFATVEIMHQYGILLEDFRSNGEFVNDCIFTMMHHVGGDLGQISVLFQPNILKTYSLIWEIEYEICDDWSDLIEYVIHKFINSPQQSPFTMNNASLPDVSSQMMSENIKITWTQEEKDLLYWYYVQCKNSETMISDILKLFRENGNQQKTRLSVIEQLLEQDIILLIKYDDLMKNENPEYERNVQTPAVSVFTSESGFDSKETVDSQSSSKALDDIQVLRDRLFKENRGGLITWLQKQLLECCYVKITLQNLNHDEQMESEEDDELLIMEPVAKHCILKKQSIPVVPWNLEQNAILCYQPFVLLLHKLGFHLPVDTSKIFVRIPEFWSADIMFSVAQNLGPIDQKLVKPAVVQYFANGQDQQIGSETTRLLNMDKFTLSRSNKSNSIIRIIPDCQPRWLQVVKQNKLALNGSHFTHNNNKSSKYHHNHDTIFSLCNKVTIPKMLTHDLSIIIETNDSNDELQIEDDLESPVLEEHEVVSACETLSIASNLTRMYVSDEEYKHDLDIDTESTTSL